MSEVDRLHDLPAEWRSDGPAREQLARVVGLSEFAFGLIQRHPEWLSVLWGDDGPGALPAPEMLRGRLEQADDGDEAARMAALRLLRNQELLRILWRDVNGLDAVPTVLAALTGLAEVLIGTAFRWAGDRLLERHGVPRDGEGQPVSLAVFGLGKLGGGELNFSSDVDLVAAYPVAGTSDGPRPLDHQEYFVRQVRQATRLLAERTTDGFVYRVDWRLRPFGEAGRLALSFPAMVEYYQREGRPWERYAWIKARPIAGDLSSGERLLEQLRPFVYRRYLDYSAFESLREMKAMVRAEVARRQLDDHIKLGEGGIREIEFIAQAFQLIRGGREPRLRQRGLLAVLDTLSDLGLLEADTVSGLHRAYLLLRRLENRLQQVSDAQTHRLPREPALQRRVARSMDYPHWQALLADLQSARAFVAETFVGVFESQAESAAKEGARGWERIWDLAGDPESLEAGLAALGFSDPETPARRLLSFRSSVAYRALGERARQRLAAFMPRLLSAVGESADPEGALESVMQVVRSIASRSAYVALLTEQRGVLERLVELCAASPWLTDLLARQPLLLDDLIDARQPSLPVRDGLDQRVERRLQTVEAGDLEAEMEVLRQIQQGQAMVMAVSALERRAEAAAIARSLTDLAESILAAVLSMTWRDLARQHGEPGGEAPAFVILGYGTLGGRELNFTSDLDLVFLHDGAEPQGRTAGERPIDNERFFLRVAQRVVHLLSTLTASGRLYEVDVRLRPNGNAGFLVTSLDQFERYQLDKAWTWELQALTRARPVAGDPGLMRRFESVRRRVLCRRRDPDSLREEIWEMREKMRRELDRSDRRRFDLKQGPGGKVDIEFLAQWARLRLADGHPEVLADTSTAAAIAAAGAHGLLAPTRIEALLAAWRHYQALAQERALAGHGSVLQAHPDEAAGVFSALTEVFGEPRRGRV